MENHQGSLTAETDPAANPPERVTGSGTGFPTRYLRIFAALGRFTLTREMAFQGNFLVKVSVEVLWLGIMLVFYDVLFQRTNAIAGWDRSQYLFFLGCFFALNGVVETFFLDNCNEFAQLVRTGELDFLLIKPIDEQFLISCRRMDWGTMPNVLMGAGLMIIALVQMDWAMQPGRLFAFFVLFCCGLVITYSFMLALTTLSIYLVRNQSLMEMWWLVSNLSRYPREIFQGTWAEPVGLVLTFVLPFLLIVSVPASTMVKVFEPALVVFMLVATVVLTFASRKFFLRGLRAYRSAGG